MEQATCLEFCKTKQHRLSLARQRLQPADDNTRKRLWLLGGCIDRLKATSSQMVHHSTLMLKRIPPFPPPRPPVHPPLCNAASM